MTSKHRSVSCPMLPNIVIKPDRIIKCNTRNLSNSASSRDTSMGSSKDASSKDSSRDSSREQSLSPTPKRALPNDITQKEINLFSKPLPPRKKSIRINPTELTRAQRSNSERLPKSNNMILLESGTS